MKAIVLIILLIVNFPLYKNIFYFIFNDVEGFKESVKYSFTPDLFSLFRGNYWKDQIGEAKLSIFILICVMLVLIEYFIIMFLIGRFI